MSTRNTQMVGVSNITNRTDPNSLKSRVFVGNLNTVHMTKTELESIFAKYGAIIGISVHKGYAFIQYANETSARSAVAGEDAKVYYSMALDVTIASEPKNRKRGRSNITNISAWPGLSSSGIPDLALHQAQALSSLASNPVLSSLQQLGLEGIMGQPNFSQFAAAASSVLGGASPLAGFNFGTTQNPVMSSTRTKHTRSSTSQPASYTTVSSLNASSSAKRTRLEGMISNQNNFNQNNNLPAGARGQNLVSLVSPSSDSGSSSHAHKISSASDQRHSGSGLSSTTQSRSTSNAVKASTSLNSVTTSKRPLSNSSVATKSSRADSDSTGRPAAEDILICGSCRRMFEQVDDLISHKMAGCSLNQGTCQSCRCRSGEPEILECAYCGATFRLAWDLMHHCHNDHGLTIYTIPSPSSSPKSTQKGGSLPTNKKSEMQQSGGSKTEDASQRNIKVEMPVDTAERDDVKSHSQAETNDGSDWERDIDDYGVETGMSAVHADHENSSEHTRTRSPSCSPVRSLKDELQDNNNDDELSVPVENSPNRHIQDTTTSMESPHGHRRRGSEYGRHETMADDYEEDVIDEEESEEQAVRSS